jgi:hypothetical protein
MGSTVFYPHQLYCLSSVINQLEYLPKRPGMPGYVRNGKDGELNLESWPIYMMGTFGNNVKPLKHTVGVLSVLNLFLAVLQRRLTIQDSTHKTGILVITKLIALMLYK